MLKLICEDSNSYIKTLQPSSIDVLISDIPYGVKINPEWDSTIPSTVFWNDCFNVLKPGSHCVIFGQPSMLDTIFKVFAGTQFEYRDMIVWSYQGTHTKGFKLEENGNLFRSKLRNVFNSILIFRKPFESTEEVNWQTYRTNLLNVDACREPYQGDHTNILKKFEETGIAHLQSEVPSNTFNKLKRKGWVPNSKGREPVNLQHISRASTLEKTHNKTIDNKHQTVKPLKLMLWLVNLFTSTPEQIVLDPFCGSGTTGCACAILNRNFIGIDNSSECINICKQRLTDSI